MEERPSPACVGDDQQDTIDLSVTRFESEAANESLLIAGLRLDLHAEAPALTRDEAIPSSRITCDRKRDLGRPTQGRMQVSRKPCQRSVLAGVSEGIAAGIGLDHEIEADNGRYLRERNHWSARRQATL